MMIVFVLCKDALKNSVKNISAELTVFFIHGAVDLVCGDKLFGQID